jgi:hypothetical protein
MPENYKHIFLNGAFISEKYKIASSFGEPRRIPSRDAASHSDKLLAQFEEIWSYKRQIKEEREAEQISTREGTYLSFTSAVEHDLVTASLENIRSGIRLLNIKQESTADGLEKVRATVYIPNGQEGYFVRKIEEYRTKVTPTGQAKNAPLVNSIEDVTTALLESMWTDKETLIPTQTANWCEVWLNVDSAGSNEQNQIADFYNQLEILNIAYKRNYILFPERAVLLINSNKSQLVELMLVSDILAEFRIGQEPAGFWVSESSKDQQEWVEDLLTRINILKTDVSICVLDSGVNNGHPLISPLLPEDKTLSYDPEWGTYDHEERAGHGTLMAGISAYGNLEKALSTNDLIDLTHGLISVKVLPPRQQGSTPKELWGDVINQSVSRAEIASPEARLVFCMAVTSAEDMERGRPSSWSGAIDNITYGQGESPRILIVSGGNIRSEELFKDYPHSNLASSIENPAQSWNAITVGAYTQKMIVNDEDYKDYEPLANEGELSPYSTTSLMWERKWPYKPDVVFEGGNLLRGADNAIVAHEDLECLSTSKSFNIKPFDTINATSAATAQASWFAAKLLYEYPDAWAETIRALIVHSARWSNSMLEQLGTENNRKSFENLIKVFGLGVPQLERALYSQESAMSFISQESIQPFILEGSRGKTNELHYYSLPWPKDLLLDLGAVPVTLRVTLSYFIEPGAGEIGWKDKYRYQSHGLRFDINNVNEDETAFRKRINVAAREDNEQLVNNSGSQRWAIGKDNRSNGSIHTDYWEGTAAELATCNLIAVYPVIGWWRERKHLNKVDTITRYALIISLDTPEQNIELYSTIMNLIEVPVEVETNI